MDITSDRDYNHGPVCVEELDRLSTMGEIGEGIKGMKNNEAPPVDGYVERIQQKKQGTRSFEKSVLWNKEVWRAAILCPIDKGKGEKKLLVQIKRNRHNTGTEQIDFQYPGW